MFNYCDIYSVKYTLGNPRVEKNFVQYPTTSDVGVLARYGLVKIVFPSVTTSELQVSVIDCRSNTLIYKEDGTPLLGTEVKPNISSRICFCPRVGGYIIYGYVTSEPTVAVEKKGSDK